MSDHGWLAAAVHSSVQPSRSTRSARGIPLTGEGRRRLEERLRLLRLTVAELGEGLHDPERRVDVVEGYQRAMRELERLESLLAEAETLDDLPDNPLRVDLGDCVSIGFDDGTEESYFVVHAEEAVVDDARVSVDSPLGRALLGRNVGEIVEVAGPGGSHSCTILAASRTDVSGAEGGP
jgi:transcription elongation GreA/GreB family factor